nr:RNA-directed DNA polymerase, eukaryota [Tanacetum cinerariifolium]
MFLMLSNGFFCMERSRKEVTRLFITLIPKVPNANMVKDFRPISLIGSLYKVIAKVLANHLVTVLDDIVDEIQSAVMTDRQILDACCRDIAFKNLVSRLYALESMKNIEVASKLSHGGLEFSFRRNLRGGVKQAQFEMLKEMIEGVTLSKIIDRWSWSLAGSGDFSVSSVRKLIDNAILPKGISKTRWIKEVSIKINVHAWKVIHDFLPTRFNISRKGIKIESVLCPMCECSVESSRHLFFSCKMISDVMRKITRWWDLEYREINSIEDWCQWISSIRLPVKQKHIFEGI